MNPINFLTELGADADAVATTLRDKGIRGMRTANTSCPIANYLTSCGFHGVKVGLTFTRMQVEDIADPATFTSIDGFLAAVGAVEYEDHLVRFVLPAPVKDFVRRFDDGAFPDLSEV